MKVKNLIMILSLLLCNACSTKDELDPLNNERVEKNISAKLQMKSVSMVGETKKPPYPIHIYIFNAKDSCVAIQRIEEDDNDTYQVSLILGAYEVYALAGADAEKYNLPTTGNAKPTAELTLKSNNTHSALEAGKAASTLNVVADDEVSCNITVKNIFAQLNVKLTQMPTTTSSIAVTVSNLTSKVHIDGSVSGIGGETTVSCSYDEASQTWSAPATLIFPGVSGEKAKIKVVITDDQSNKKEITVTADRTPESNHPYNLNLKYEKGSISGNISSSDWEAPIEEDIVLNPSTPADPSEEPEVPAVPAESEIPAAGTVWNNCLVLSVSNPTKSGADLLLLSTKEWQIDNKSDITESMISGKIAGYTAETGIPNWIVPTYLDLYTEMSSAVEAQTLTTLNAALSAAGKQTIPFVSHYLMRREETQSITSYLLRFAESSCTYTSYSTRTPPFYLRLVTRYHFEKSNKE